MDNEIKKLIRLGYLALLFGITILLIACNPATKADPDPITGPGQGSVQTLVFGQPLSNQVEVHEDSESEGKLFPHSHDYAQLDEAEISDDIDIVLVPTELVVGPNRFAIGLFRAGKMVQDAQVHLHYFDLTDSENPFLEMETDAYPVQTPDGLSTIFAHERTFNRAGHWGVEVQARFPDNTSARQGIGFTVAPESASLIPGDRAPNLDTPTMADVKGDLSQLTSATRPNPAFYELTLAEAIQNPKQTLLLIATPGFCQTRFCGPNYDIISELQQRYTEDFNFIHVEVYTGLPNPASNDWEVASIMAEFGLKSEPWVFLLDDAGKVIYRVEGLFTEAEVDRQLQILLQ